MLRPRLLEHHVQRSPKLRHFNSHESNSLSDDVAIMTKCNTLSEEEVLANSDFAYIEKWAKDNKMLFNDTKSKAMLITRKRNNENVNIYLNN